MRSTLEALSTIDLRHQDPVLAARGLRKAYGTVEVLRGADLDVHRGRSVAVVGPSGSGKTTLLHLLAGVDAADSGSVRFDGAEILSASEAKRTALRRSSFGFVFQQGLLVPELSAEENAALPLLLGGTRRGDALARARVALHRLAVGDLAQRLPGQMSGGQAQRVAVARALAHEPSVVFADEPTGALDRDTATETASALLEAARSAGAAVVVITHDAELAARCDERVSLRDGLVVRDEAAAQHAGAVASIAEVGR